MSRKEASSPPLQYKPPMRGLLGRLPTPLNSYCAYTLGKQSLRLAPGDEQPILTNPVSHEIIHNDGSSTFIVHGTDKTTADKITEHGLGLNGHYYQSEIPDLLETTKMLAPLRGRGSRGAINRNVHGLAYRYDRGDYGASSGYKVVAELALPNPGTSLRHDQFRGTALERADGVNIVSHGDGATDQGKPFSIPPERIRGYFDIETGEFIHNKRFVAVADVVGQMAAGHETEQRPPSA